MNAILLIVFAAKFAVCSSIIMFSSIPNINLYVGQGLSPQTSLVTLNSPVDLACVYSCWNYYSKFNLPCYAAQYISSTKKCVLQVSCTVVQLTSNLTSKTYLLGTSMIQQSNLILPLTTACSSSLTAQYGAANFTVVHTGTPTTTASTVTSINAAITYPLSASATSYTMVNDTSQSGALNVLAGDFTISFAFKYTTPPSSTGCSSHPMLTFLGAASGSQCMSIVTGCCGTCPQLLYWSSCSCLNPAAGTGGGAATNNYYTSNVDLNYWTHTTYVYKSSLRTLYTFMNGLVQSTWTSVTFSPAVSQYRVMVGAVECYYGWGNQFPGSIACVTVSTAAFGNQDVLMLYRQCLQQEALSYIR